LSLRAAVLTPPEVDLAVSGPLHAVPTDQQRDGFPHLAPGAKGLLERDSPGAIQRGEGRHAGLAGRAQTVQSGCRITRQPQMMTENADKSCRREIELLCVVDEYMLEDLALCLTHARRIAYEIAGVLGRRLGKQGFMSGEHTGELALQLPVRPAQRRRPGGELFGADQLSLEAVDPAHEPT
jgi:hypothetical protein